MASDTEILTRTAASAAVASLGWRHLLGRLMASVPVASLADAAVAAASAVAACGDRAEGHLRLDLRTDRLELALQTPQPLGVTALDTELAKNITTALTAAGFTVGGATSAERPRPVQVLELAIDTLDMAAIRPFWKAVLSFVDEPVEDGELNGLNDPTGQLPSVWFQQLDAARPQRNRIHLDLTIAHDEVDHRLQAALAAGGVLVSDRRARAFWILADVDGNEVCLCTWQDRDPT